MNNVHALLYVYYYQAPKALEGYKKINNMGNEQTKSKKNVPMYYWITTPNQALLKELGIKHGKVAPVDTKAGLYYPYTEEGLEEAKDMLRKIKEAIFYFNSTSKVKQGWITKEWLNAPIKVK